MAKPSAVGRDQVSPARPNRRATPRKERATDAAIEVIAEAGLRGLTHRAVDTKAGLPPGSTSSCFRTRLALLSAVLDRLVELDEALIAPMRPDILPPGPDGDARMVDLLTELLGHWLGPARARTRARLELYLDAARHEPLAAELEAANRRFVDRTAEGLRALGIDEPAQAARLLLAQLDGLLYDALARPFLRGEERLRQSVRAIVRGLR